MGFLTFHPLQKRPAYHTRPEDIRPVFHPDFAQPDALADDNVILETEDKTQFFQSLSQLASFSSFFEGIKDMGFVLDEPISLPRATGDELALILAVHHLPPYSIVPKRLGIQLVLHYRASKYQTADAFEFDGFVPLVDKIAKNGLFEEPFTRIAWIALALVLKVDPSRDAATLTVGAYLSEMPPEIDRLLRREHSKEARLLSSIHKKTDPRLDQLKLDLMYKWPMYNGIDDFGKKCKGLSDDSKGRCESFVAYRGCFALMRAKAGESVFESSRKRNRFPVVQDGTDDIAHRLHDSVTCQRCRTRLVRTFVAAARHSTNHLYPHGRLSYW